MLPPLFEYMHVPTYKDAYTHVNVSIHIYMYFMRLHTHANLYAFTVEICLCTCLDFLLKIYYDICYISDKGCDRREKNKESSNSFTLSKDGKGL